jgi:D-arabinose 5-phosphate isomerase GutQ
MDFNAAEDSLILEGIVDANDANVSLGASADGDVLLTFGGSGATVELNGFQAANYANLGQLDAAINITYQP